MVSLSILKKSALATYCLILLASADDKPWFCNEIQKHVTPPTVEGATLKHVTILHRHGDRARSDDKTCWDQDPMKEDFRCNLRDGAIPLHANETSVKNGSPIFKLVFQDDERLDAKGCYVGQLTEKGFNQHRLNGEALNRMYIQIGFLSEKLDQSKVYLRSDIKPRVLQSIQSLTLAMFPGSFQENGSQIIDIDVVEYEIDPIALHFPNCSRHEYLNKLRTLLPSEEEAAWKKEVKIPMQRKIANLLNTTSWRDVSLGVQFDCMVEHICNEYSMPEGIGDLYMETSEAWLLESTFEGRYPSIQERAPIHVGTLLKNFYDGWKRAIEGGESRISIFSGHDSTVIYVLLALGYPATEIMWPKYASVLNWELLEMNGEHWIRFIHDYGVVRLPFCEDRLDGLCSFDTVEKHFKKLMPTNLKQQCEVTKEELDFLYQLEHPHDNDANFSRNVYYNRMVSMTYVLCIFVSGMAFNRYFGHHNYIVREEQEPLIAVYNNHK